MNVNFGVKTNVKNESNKVKKENIIFCKNQ